MDVGRIINLAQAALDVDSNAAVTQSLATVAQRLNDLASNPADQPIQLSVTQALANLRSATLAAQSYFSPDELDQLVELTKVPLFSSDALDRIENVLRENPAAPAAALTELNSISAARDLAFSHLRQFLVTSEALGWSVPEECPWEAEVGFLIPRSLFENEFDGLLGELRYLRRFLAHLSELNDTSMADVKLSSLSTTDPWFVLGVGSVLAIKVGVLTAWGLDQWKKVEEIRKIRAETAKLASFSAEEVEAIFGNKIREEIERGIEAKTVELVAGVKPKGRQNELSNALRKDLSEFLGRLERGLRVEVRLIGGSDAQDADEGSEEAAGDTLRTLSSSLVFPQPSQNPVLQISHLPPEKA